MSGGADSALLLYILMKNSTKKIHIFTCASKVKQFGTVKSSTDVIRKCVELTGNLNIAHHMHYVESQNDHVLFAPYREFIDKGIVNLIYHGVTSNPPANVLETFVDKINQPVLRDSKNIKSLYKMGSNLYTPLTNSNKQKISEMYKELDLLDNLFPLTRSCESLDLSEGHCGHCWWCQEREWGFGRLV